MIGPNRIVAVALAVMFGAVLSPPPAAADPPLIVQDRDQPIRNPYQQGLQTSCQYAGDCALLFSVVPANRRRVIEHVSCFLTLPSSGYITSALLFAQNFRLERDFLPVNNTTTNNGTSTTIINVNTLVYYGGNGQPRLDVYTYGAALTNFYCTLVGYEIDVP